ncbi:hypothetical protein C7408_10337 [Paraburkholderia caballeronis]|nr:hypothetical protein C7408_10337 [Paraburkholderia caballeronis]TDV20180.1 hypothetical protein C7406_103404 [Paraburkholderia caballeronis]TDV28397.1 hypothetical protein C7404_103404 [Paraburkholderia caballeronis]TDV36912.1 hypothetical protein C7405_10337 [Paraburkholderia caballeronis]
MQPTTPSTAAVPSQVPTTAAARGLRTVAFSLLVDRALAA